METDLVFSGKSTTERKTGQNTEWDKTQNKTKLNTEPTQNTEQGKIQSKIDTQLTQWPRYVQVRHMAVKWAHRDKLVLQLIGPGLCGCGGGGHQADAVLALHQRVLGLVRLPHELHRTSRIHFPAGSFLWNTVPWCLSEYLCSLHQNKDPKDPASLQTQTLC